MLIVSINGGLGNQLFQYALGKSLALKYNCKLFLDLSQLRLKTHQTQRRYLLDHLKINGAVIPPLAMTFLNAISQMRLNMITKYSEPSNNFNKTVDKLGQNVILSGYWQSYKYFENIKNILIREFEPKNELVFDKSITKAINGSNSVSLHVRRGDYLTNTAAKSLLGALSLSYYVESIAYISAKVANPQFVIVSEDLVWARQNLKKYLPKSTRYFHKDELSDFAILKRTRHSIIANSSYSWWPAYLGEKSIVIAPKRWYRSGKISTRDLIPKKWIQI